MDGLVVEDWGFWRGDLMFKSMSRPRCEPTYLVLVLGLSGACGLWPIAGRPIDLVERKPGQKKCPSIKKQKWREGSAYLG